MANLLISNTYPKRSFLQRAKLLTLSALFLFGCSFLEPLHPEFGDAITDGCNNRASVRLPLDQYITDRYPRGSLLRLGIFPFSTSAKLAYSTDGFSSFGERIAEDFQSVFLRSGKVGVAEVFDPQDWPEKKTEFFKGNYGSIAWGKQAGYDLILVGYLDRQRGIDELHAYAKLIDVNLGVTVWYGESTVGEVKYQTKHGDPWWFFGSRRLDKLPIHELREKLVSCLAENVFDDEGIGDFEM